MRNLLAPALFHALVQIQHAQEVRTHYDRNHPGIASAGQGDAGTAFSKASIRGEAGGRMRYGHD